MSSLGYKMIPGAINNRMIAAMRLVLAASGLLVIYIDPSEPDRCVALAYTTLILYVVYSAVLYASAWRPIPLVPTTITHWVDVGWYAVLISLSSGTNSIFLFFFFFAIMIASFQWGLRSGLCVACASATLSFSIGFVTTPAGADLELNRLLLQPISLLVLGYMVAYWGESELTLKRRLVLLKDINTLSNPRFGVDRTLGTLMERLRAFYDADVCLLVTTDLWTSEHRMRRVDRRDPEAATRSEPITEDLASLLLMLPIAQAVIARNRPRLWRWRYPEASGCAYDVVTGKRIAVPPPVSGVLAAKVFITVPFYCARETIGRLYLTAPRRRAFNTEDVHFLSQVLAQAIPTLQTIQLVDQLASTAAEAERQRIARDLHDSVLQPYVGLRLGLAALSHNCAMGDTDIGEDLKQLCTMTDIGISDLRFYMSDLKENSACVGDLLSLVQHFAERFAKTTGIAVHVEAETPMSVHDRLAAQACHIIAEGLSNVRRHTTSTRATISMACSNGHLTLRIVNDGAAGAASTRFCPRSITERAAALGGCARVEQSATNGTLVEVTIPL
jgi:signal transduction histidine kinase